MMLTSAPHRLLASSLALLLISCSVTRHAPTAPAKDALARFALVINELPDGRTDHSWQDLEELDLSQYPSPPNGQDTTGQLVRAAWTRDCEQERDACEDDCMRGRMRPGYGHVTTPDRKRGAKYDLCRQKCMQPYLDCCRLRELDPQRFAEPDAAVTWLKRHHKKLLLGTVIVIAGMVFVTVSAGAGALVLMPIVPTVMMTSSGLPAEPSTLAVSP